MRRLILLPLGVLLILASALMVGTALLGQRELVIMQSVDEQPTHADDPEFITRYPNYHRSLVWMGQGHADLAGAIRTEARQLILRSGKFLRHLRIGGLIGFALGCLMFWTSSIRPRHRPSKQKAEDN